MIYVRVEVSMWSQKMNHQEMYKACAVCGRSDTVVVYFVTEDSIEHVR